MHRSFTAAAAVCLLSLTAQAVPQLTPGRIASHQKISALEGGFQAFLGVNDQIGRAVACIGDLDGDGIGEIATAGHADDDGGVDKGAIYVLFPNADGTVRQTTKISERWGNFTGELDAGDQFGRAIGRVGDVDGDGTPDVVVGANFDDDGGTNRGAIYVLFLEADGTVREHTKISNTEGGFTGELDDEDEFGRAFAPLGDFDGDGTPDLAVGSPYDDDGAWNAGAIWILYLNPDGTVKTHGKISQTQGRFGGVVGQLDYFGWSLDTVDLDGDGVLDIVTGEVLDDHSTEEYSTGAVWWLFMNPDGTVKEEAKINQLRGGFTGDLDTKDQFGVSVAVVGDMDGDGITDLIAGARFDDDGVSNGGALYVLFLEGLLPQPEALFTTDLQSGDAPLEVSFSDASLGPVTTWTWDFGDGAVSFDPDPLHVYTTPGTYTVALTVTGPGGESRLEHPGAIVVGDPALGGRVTPYGCGENPAASLLFVGGDPRPGGRLTFGADNPLGTQNPGSIPRLAISLSPDGAFPCGTLRPNFGMEAAGAPGGFLIDPTRIVALVNGEPWTGPGAPASVGLFIPGDANLLGTRFYVQGLLVDRMPTGGPRVGLTGAFEVLIGP